MPSILTKYFLKRWAAQLMLGFVFFGGLLLAWEVKIISQTIFEHHASLRNLIPLLLSTIPWNVGLVLPMAAVLGGLMGTQFLSEGSELVASQGLGHGARGFLIPWALLSATLVVFSVLNAHWITPWASRAENALYYKMFDETAMSEEYMPRAGEEPRLIKGDVFLRDPQDDGQRKSALSGQRVYFGKSASDGKLHLIQIGSDTVSHLISDSYSRSIVKAKSNPDDHFEEISLSFRFEDLSGKAASKALEFDGRLTDLSYKVFEVSRSLQVDKGSIYAPTSVRHVGTGDLLGYLGPGEGRQKSEARIELSRRFSNPLICCALLLCGIALGISHPRFYRGGAFVMSIGMIVLYFIFLKLTEGWIVNNRINWIYSSVQLPLLFLVAGWVLLLKKLNPKSHSKKNGGVLSPFFNWAKNTLSTLTRLPSTLSEAISDPRGAGYGNKVIARWTSRKWWGNFAAVLAVLLTIHIFAEFAFLAARMSFGAGQMILFFKYWIHSAPVALAYMFPLVFLLAWTLTFSDASVNREWTALRAGGASLVQWAAASWKAWGLALLAAFLVEAYIAPMAYTEQNNYYRQLKAGKAAVTKRASLETPTTLFLGNTGVFWYTEGGDRWGFPMLSPPDAPSLLHWGHGQPSSIQLDWGSTTWTPGPGAETLFPSHSLRQYGKAAEIPTLDLFVWQAWAPNSERGTMLWGRLLKWLAGPCLFFAALGFVFPPPRKGRGQALGYALVLSLVFLFLQFVFEGASKAGQLPPLWGVVAPMLLLLGFGLVNLRRLRT